MPRAACPKCRKLLYPIQETYFCLRCNLKFGKKKETKEQALTKKDRDFLKKVKVKWQ